MTQLSGIRILVVDDNPENSWKLRDRLISEGATVHVAESAKVALLMIEQSRINVAFVPYAQDNNLAAVTRTLLARNIPQIFTGWSEAAIKPAARLRHSKAVAHATH